MLLALKTSASASLTCLQDLHVTNSVHIAQIKCHPGGEEPQLLLCVKGIEHVELALSRQIIELVEI